MIDIPTACRLILFSAMLALPLPAGPIFRDRSFYPNPTFDLDLDRDSKPDVHLDLSRVSTAPDNPYYLATPLGSASIAATKDITTSFSAGDVVHLSKLDFKPAPATLKTGGVYRDMLGNFVGEGWGAGVTFDPLGNIIFPAGGPPHQVDHFLVRMDHGVAWVDLDSLPYYGSGASIDVRWGYLENPEDTFIIKSMKPGKRVEVQGKFATGSIFTIQATNHSSLVAALDIRHGKLVYEIGAKSFELKSEKDYNRPSRNLRPRILWGHAELRSIHDIDNFVTWPEGTPIKIDLKNGRFWYEVRIEDEIRKIRIRR